MELKPCPFCGAGETQITSNRLVEARMDGKISSPYSYTFKHWCMTQPNKIFITFNRKTEEQLIEAWDKRVDEIRECIK